MQSKGAEVRRQHTFGVGQAMGEQGRDLDFTVGAAWRGKVFRTQRSITQSQFAAPLSPPPQARDSPAGFEMDLYLDVIKHRIKILYAETKESQRMHKNQKYHSLPSIKKLPF